MCFLYYYNNYYYYYPEITFKYQYGEQSNHPISALSTLSDSDLKFINVISSSSQAAAQSALNIYYSFNITRYTSGNPIRSNSSGEKSCALSSLKHFSGQIMCI